MSYDDSEVRVRACYYCGLPADSVDHVIPKCIVGDRTEFVWSCRDCNTALGAKLFKDAPAKRQWIKQRLRRKYERLLAAPEWTEAELAKLGPSLRRYVKTQIRKREVIRARLAWPWA